MVRRMFWNPCTNLALVVRGGHCTDIDNDLSNISEMLPPEHLSLEEPQVLEEGLALP
jgi:hypothetical protein